MSVNETIRPAIPATTNPPGVIQETAGLVIHVSGIDISGYQDPVNMQAVRDAGFSFVYAKCTQGTGYVEPTYGTRLAQAKAAGILFGAYHFMEWDDDAGAQAATFLKHANIERGDLPPMLDCEWPITIDAANAVAAMSIWLTAVTKSIGCFPVVYMSPAFWSGQLGSTDGFTGHPLWLAEYGVQSPQNLGSWKPAFWQKSSAGNVAGIQGNVDLDDFLGSLDQLQAMRIK